MYLPETTTYSEFRQNLSSHFKRLKRSAKPTLITQNGKTAAVVMGLETYEQLVSDAEEARSIARLQNSRRQARDGKTRPASDVFADLYARISRPAPRPKRNGSRPSRNGHRRG